jgi:hypothetical protein
VNGKILRAFALAAGSLICSSLLIAHHSNSLYDRDHQTELKGEVTDFQWINPHIRLLFTVRGSQGSVTNWMSEGPSPSQMTENGWKKGTLKPGDHVSIVGNLARDGSPTMRLRWVTLANGKDLFGYRN